MLDQVIDVLNAFGLLAPIQLLAVISVAISIYLYFTNRS